MGGTKNRDNKMAANKIFSSAGGGGGKGPATIDKRGQEVKCPYCDKIYKESGRLKDHISKHHPDETRVVPPSSSAAPKAAATTAAARPGAAAVPLHKGGPKVYVCV
ncbi:hypothetical protein FOA52_014565 [Chlamydomonas sp. UWO 241]|nr:hypothetical protein FOA52_014565 [Chlamydomonas sp. UWO 241]